VPSSWLQLSVRTDPAAFDAVCNFLIERGSPGVVINKNELQAYFAHSSEDASIRRDVQRFLRGINGVYPDIDESRLRWKVLKDRNWNSAWRRFFIPQKIGKAFWVAPPWAKPREFRRRQVITIEPGMAFGTGTHATTRGCLEFLESAMRCLNHRAPTALDVGTGSGILAIALAKLGARKVWAVDSDPVALKVAQENIRSNGVQEKIILTGTQLSGIGRSFQIVVANLTAVALIDLAGVLQKKVAQQGFLILSGILNPKAEDVIGCFSSNGFRVVRRKREKEWVTLLLRRH
jgi:ribosomal protein L11 methyltransferase